MLYKWDKKYLYWGITAFFVIVFGSVFLVIAFNYKNVFAHIASAVKVFTPVFWGFAFAYLLTPVENFYEKKCFRPIFLKINAKRVKREMLKNPAVTPKDRANRIKRISRNLGVAASVITALAAIAALISVILPQTIVAVQNIINNMTEYTNEINKWGKSFFANSPDLFKKFADVTDAGEKQLTDWLLGLIPKIDTSSVLKTGKETIGVLINLIMGFVIGIYLLHGKELFAAQGKKILYALFRPKTANAILENTRHINRTFGGFITGKIIDSLIIGMIFFIILTILDIPYAVLLSVILGITNIIPYFGPFIGAIPCAFIVLVEDPWKCLYLIIVIIVVQQFDGNFLGPKILGDVTGLSSFWVIFALLAGSYFFNFIGFIVGVPLFAVLYSLVKARISDSLEKKGLPSDTDVYRNVDNINSESGELVMRPSEIYTHKKKKKMKNE